MCSPRFSAHFPIQVCQWASGCRFRQGPHSTDLPDMSQSLNVLHYHYYNIDRLYVQNSFLPRAIDQWNCLIASIVHSSSTLIHHLSFLFLLCTSQMHALLSYFSLIRYLFFFFFAPLHPQRGHMHSEPISSAEAACL